MNCDSTSSGIYKITCTPTGRFYVGSAINFSNRCYLHEYHLKRKTHKNKPLQSAWNKYGGDQFTFVVLEEVPKERLLTVEQSYLDEEQPFDRKGFNIMKVAGNVFGYKHTEASLKRMSERARLRSKPNRRVSVDQFTTDGVHVKTWDTIKEAAKFYGAKSANSIKQVIGHPRWLFRGFVWKKRISDA